MNEFDFNSATVFLLKGKKIKRVSWTAEAYCLLASGRLCIFIDNELKDWIVTEEDLLALDWVVV